MNFDEEEDDEDEISSSSSQLNSNTRPGSATSKKSSKVKTSHHAFKQESKKCRFSFVAQLDMCGCLKVCFSFMTDEQHCRKAQFM